MGKISFAVAALAVYLASAPDPVEACIHAAGEHGPVPVTQKGHQGLIVWDGGQQELILKLEYESGGDPSALGLVIPVPAVPSNYETAPGALFDELADWVKLRRDQPQPRSRSMGMTDSVPSNRPTQSLVALPPAAAGPYRIQPLQAFGDEGVTALTEWMEANHFAPIPRAMLSYYTTRGWTFLTVKVDPEAGATLGRRGGLPPLRVRFATERALYPLKLEAQGTFPVRLYLLTREPLDDEAFAGAQAHGFEVAAGAPFRALGGSPGRQLRVDVGRFRLPSAPPALRAVLRDIGGFDEGEMTLRVLLNPRFGEGPGNSMNWEEETSFPPMPAGQRLMGTAGQATAGANSASAQGPAGAAGTAETPPSTTAAQDPSTAQATEPTQPAATASGPGAAAGADESGGCSAAEGSGSGAGLMAGALLLLAANRRRRRTR